MAIDLSAPKGSSKAHLERRALLIQWGGYTINGCERIHSGSARARLEAVTVRKARSARVTAAAVARNS